MVSLSAELVVTGPAFDGRAERALDDFGEAWRHEIGEQGVAQIKGDSWSTFRNPSGAWASGVRHEDRADTTVIHDSRSVYGPWLEGVSRRNQTTPFKGYSLMRKQAQALRQNAAQYGLLILPQFLPRMN